LNLFLSTEAFDFLPVDAVPEGLEVLVAAVLKLEVIGMFPDIDAQKGLSGSEALEVHQGIVLVGCGSDKKPAIAGFAKPCPT
jgi:hypothetical protein